MKKTVKILILILVLSILAGSLVLMTACNKQGESTDAAAKEKLVVGLECAYIPFNFTQQTDQNGAVKISNADGYANGYDILIAKRIAEALNRELVIMKTEWDSLVPGVKAGTLDLVIAGMSPTDERRASIDFSESYYESNLVVVVKKGSKWASAKSLDDFKGANLVAQQGTFHNDALQTQADAHGIKAGTPMSSFPLMTSALKANTIDGYVAEEPGAIADCAANKDLTYVHLTNNKNGFTATAEDTQIAIGMRYGSEFKDAINAVLLNLSSQDRLEIMQDAVKYATENANVPETFFARIGHIFNKYFMSILKGVGYTLWWQSSAR